jgi:hypothetical protein
VSHEPHVETADYAPLEIDGRNGGMSLKEICRRLKNFLRSKDRQQPDQKNFGWLTLKQKQAAKRAAERKAVNFRAAQEHPLETGVRRFRVRDDDPWKKL